MCIKVRESLEEVKLEVGAEFSGPINIEQDGNPYTVGTRAQALEKAKQEGLIVVLPEPNQLFIDIDNNESMAVFGEYIDILDKYLPLKGYVTAPSKSGGERRHVTVTLSRDVTPLERVALQAMLGSDRKRELLSFIRVVQGDEDPTVFFEKPEPIQVIEDDIPF